MKINVSQIKKELGASEKVEFVQEISSNFLPKEIKLAGPVEIKASVINTGDSMLVKGRLKVPAKMQCNRCLEDYTIQLKAELEEEYYPAPEEEEEASSKDYDKATYQNDLIDITPLVEEVIFLSIPMKPLCGETCQGLCTHCGQNLNLETCNCDRGIVDPRLEALKQLLENKD